MSYEIRGFDPIDPNGTAFDVHHANIENVGFHMVDFNKALAVADVEKVTLIDSPLMQGVPVLARLPARHLKATLSSGNNFEGDPAYFYSATIDLHGGKGLGNGTKKFEQHCRRGFDDLKVVSFIFNTMRLLTDKANEHDALLSYWQKTQTITLDNQASHHVSGASRRQHRLIAPEKSKTDTGKQYVHFIRSIAASLLVATSIDRPYRRGLAPYDFVMTPKGPLYFNPDSGEWVHQLSLQKTEITPPKVEKAAKDIQERTEVSPQTAKRLEDTTFADLYGIEDVIEQLGPLVAYYKNPEAAAKLWDVKRPSGVFLEGPAGNAKTCLIYALANAIGATVHYINAKDLYAKYFGESEAKTTAVFDKVRDATTPQILFFDEFEGLIATADGVAEGSRTYNVVAGTYKKESLRIIRENNNVILAGASNKPEAIDEALIRDGRFDIKITIGNPLLDARKKMFGHHIISMENYGHVDPDDTKGDTGIFRRFAPGIRDADVLSELAALTEDFSGASILSVLEAAKQRKFLQEVKGQKPGPITREDLITEIMRKRR